MSSSTRRRRTNGAASASVPPTTAIHVAAAGPPCSSLKPKSPGQSSWKTTPAARASGRTNIASRLESTAVPPANANANGRKPAARRDCDSDTTSESRSKRNGVSVTASTASDPPSTSDDQQARPRKPRERNEHERGDDDGAAPAEDFGGETKARPVHDQLRAVMHRRAVREHVALQRQQRERDGSSRDRDGHEGCGDPSSIRPVDERADGEPARERDAEKRRIGRMHERERESRHHHREQRRPRRLTRVHEDERQQRRDEQLPC